MRPRWQRNPLRDPHVQISEAEAMRLHGRRGMTDEELLAACTRPGEVLLLALCNGPWLIRRRDAVRRLVELLKQQDASLHRAVRALQLLGYRPRPTLRDRLARLFGRVHGERTVCLDVRCSPWTLHGLLGPPLSQAAVSGDREGRLVSGGCSLPTRFM